MEHGFGFETDAHGWLTLILAEYRHIQRRVPGLAALSPPNIVLSDAMTRTLGAWNPERRTITLSTRLLAGRRWHLLVRTLEHEVAHQVVSELFGKRGAPPHGHAFRRACELVGADPHATMDASVFDLPASPADRVRERIAKLLALGTSENQHEAELALARAHELGLKYNLAALDTLERRAYEFRLIDRPRKRIPSYTWAITQIVTDFYFVQYICRSHACDADRSRLRVIEFYGTRHNLDLAEYVFHFLKNQGHASWRAYRAEHDLPNDRPRLSFLKGLYAGFHARLTAERDTLEQRSRALVWVGDPDLDDFYRDRNPHVRTSRTRSRHYAAAHRDGVDVGTELQLRPGVAGESTGSSGPRPALPAARPRRR